MRERNEDNERSGKPRRGRWSQAEIARFKELYGLRDDASVARDLNRPLASVRKMADKLFPPGDRSGPWSEEELAKLRSYLGASPREVIARILGRTLASVEAAVVDLSRVRREGPWTRDEVALFKRIYGTRNDEDLALVFGRSQEEIQTLAAEHALAKDKAFVRKRSGEAATRMPRWSAAEVEVLKELYSDVANLEIARRLDRTVKSVVSKAHNLGLKKSNERLQRMGRENVSLRYQDGEEPTVQGGEAQTAPEAPGDELVPEPPADPGVEPIVELPVSPPPAATEEPEPEKEIPRPAPPAAEQSAGDERSSTDDEASGADGPAPHGI